MPWIKCVEQLQIELPTQQFNTWIRPLQAEFNNEELKILAPNRFVLDWVKDKYTNRIRDILRENNDTVDIKVSFSVGEDDFYLGIAGKFNVYNALVAITLAKKEKIEMSFAKEALKEMKVMPGRMEEVQSSPFRVIVDYAVTPVTLEGVYKELLENFSPKRIIAVLGSCGGGRDKWKRPVLGEIASKYCEKVIVTNEDPYDEDPEKIIDEIILGTKGKGEKIVDRREAIKKAVKEAEEGDIVIVTGKGNEPWMCLKGGKKIPWDDREIIKEELNKLI